MKSPEMRCLLIWMAMVMRILSAAVKANTNGAFSLVAP